MEILKYACQNLIRKRMQMMLTVCGIAIGVYSVLLIASIGRTGQEIIDHELQKLGFDCITVSATDKTLGQLDEKALMTIQGMEEVALAAPLTTSFGQVIMREYIGDALVCGIDENAVGIMEITLKSGRLLRRSDVSSLASVCLVDDKMAQAYYKRDNIVGKQLTLTVDGVTQELEVVGVVSSDQSALKNLMGDYVPAFVYIPYTTYQEFSKEDTVDQVFVRVREEESTQAAGEAIAGRLSLAAGYTNLYHFEDLAVQKDRINSIIQSVTVILAAIGAVSLVVSGLSIMTIMIVSVRDRTREIGIKKAIGARERDILAEFLAESLMMAVLGSGIGAMACAATALVIQWITKITFVLDFELFLGVVLFSSAVGVIFGVYPAKLASKLRPVDALRYE